MKNIKSNKFYMSLITLVLFSIMFTLNRLYPLHTDDWLYAFVYDSDTPTQRIGGFFDILRSQWIHYFEWGGRSVVHVILQTLVFLPAVVHDMLNTLAYVFLIVIIYKIGNLSSKQQNILLFILIHIFIWFAIPDLSEDVFWITGSANYLWGCLIILLFLYTYCKAFIIDNDVSNSKYRNILFFFAGIIAGWTNENMALAMIFFIVCILFLFWTEKRKIPVWMIVGLVGAIIGCLIMLKAPGNYVRRELTLQALTNDSEPMYMFYFYRFTLTLKAYRLYTLIPACIYIISFIIHYKYKNKTTNNRVVYLSALFFLTSIVATIVMIGSPYFPTRAWFGIIVLIIVATIILIADLDYSNISIKRTVNSFIAIVFVVFCYSYYLGLNDLIRINKIWTERDRVIQLEKEKGNQHITLYDKYEPSQSCLSIPKLIDVPMDEDGWMSKSYGRYHGVKSIVIVDAKTENK